MTREEGLAKIASGELTMESFHMEMGDVIIRTPLALHRGTPNRTETGRPMVVMGYVRSWLYTPNLEMKVPRQYYESLPEHLQKMLRCEVVEAVADERTETYLEFKY